MKQTLIVTTIAQPNKCLTELANGAVRNGYDFVCIGDNKSPQDFELENCDFYSVERQSELNFKLAKLLPFNHYCRKNLGYLLAVRSGADRILETDDDNFPEQDFWKQWNAQDIKTQVIGDGWINIYSYFGVDAWPRGYPLERINSAEKFTQDKFSGDWCIVQSLVNGDPDVDAIFRLTRGLGVEFGQYEAIALAENVWCPFNSQNTYWNKSAFPLLYLPVTCSFRATDIIRSYVAQRCLWAMQGHLVFNGANARQIRNEHNLLIDFEQEVTIYLYAEKIKQVLTDLELRFGDDYLTISKNLYTCYESLVKLGVILEQELPMIKAWSQDLGVETLA